MNPNHCPNPALLIAYASGSLTEAFSLVVASHLSFCKECKAKVSDAEMIGGALIDKLDPSNVNLNSLDQILSKLDDISQDPPTVSLPSDDDEIPQPLWNYINSPLDDLNWKFLAPGLRHVSIDADAGKSGTVRLFKITPGTTLPTHSHSGTELALILRGSYSDEIGRFQRG
ncbi:MAG: ChrR family anti-sigma-E factor [bacterium]